MRWYWVFLYFFCLNFFVEAKVELGIDLFFKENYAEALKGKRVGLITNHTGVNGRLESTVELFKEHARDFHLVALFGPEHGIKGTAYASEAIEDGKDSFGIPIYSLHGKTRRPNDEMLRGIDVLVYDIQDIGCRSYTYETTLFYVMEEAAKRGITVIVLDRPNPINGLIVDGPMLSENWRSFIGYINVPYCHGMTIGELARFFNERYQVGCKLLVVPMRGWKRSMSFEQTGLNWVPTSPYIPEPSSPLFYATTGILGELNLVSIGGGYSLPFKLVGAPWIHAKVFAQKLNEQKMPGVHFIPFYYRPFYGAHKGLDCQGVMIVVTDRLHYRPLSVQYLLLGMLKTLYPEKLQEHLDQIDPVYKKLFCQANGNEEIFNLLKNEKYAAWKMIQVQKEEREAFLPIRKKYLLYSD